MHTITSLALQSLCKLDGVGHNPANFGELVGREYILAHLELQQVGIFGLTLGLLCYLVERRSGGGDTLVMAIP